MEDGPRRDGIGRRGEITEEYYYQSADGVVWTLLTAWTRWMAVELAEVQGSETYLENDQNRLWGLKERDEW